MFTQQLPSISLSRSAECVLSEAKSVRFFNDVNELAVRVRVGDTAGRGDGFDGLKRVHSGFADRQNWGCPTRSN
jgi:hypothetical protein